MELTAITDQALKQLISETSKVELNFLAAKILLATLRAKVKVDLSPATLAHSVSELKDLLTRFEKLPAVQSDLQKLGVAAPASAANQVLFSVEEVSAKIAEGRNLVLAGDRALLKQLPAGTWIGGTIPYFMATQGGTFTKEKIFVTEVPSFASSVSVKTYTESTIALCLQRCPGERPEHRHHPDRAPRISPSR